MARDQGTKCEEKVRFDFLGCGCMVNSDPNLNLSYIYGHHLFPIPQTQI